MYGLGGRRDCFVVEYCKDYNASKAAVRAGYSEPSADSYGSQLLADIRVRDAIKERERELANVKGLTKEWLINQWIEVAQADPNDLVKIEILPCPHCWDGGPRVEIPNPMCALCSGRGQRFVNVADTSKLRGPARRLYAGAVQTKDGIKILMRDQDVARDNLAKYLGLVINKGEIAGPGGGPIPLATLKAEDLSDEQLAALVSGQPIGS